MRNARQGVRFALSARYYERMTADEVRNAYHEASALVVAEHAARMDALLERARMRVQGTKDQARIDEVRARLAKGL